MPTLKPEDIRPGEFAQVHDGRILEVARHIYSRHGWSVELVDARGAREYHAPESLVHSGAPLPVSEAVSVSQQKAVG